MNTFLKLAFLFYIGSSLGWVLELFFRRFISGNNPERKWINPGFMVGPYVPLYGTGLCILYLVSRLSESRQIADPVWNHIAIDRKSTRLNSSHKVQSRMPSSA